jgi:diacylglycerol O-acyltransferase / wax synthase
MPGRSATLIVETDPAGTLRRPDLLTQTFLAMQSRASNPTDLYFGALLRSSGSMPDILSLRAHVSRHLLHLPVLSHRLASAEDGSVRWEPDPDFDIGTHVTASPQTSPDAVPAGEWLGDAPGRDRPLWRMILLPGPGAQWGLAYLVHHAAQDGTAMMHALEVLFGDKPAAGPSGLPARRRRPWHALLAVPPLLGTVRPAPPVTAMARSADAARVLTHRSVDLADLRSIAASAGTTIGQVHLAAVAGAIRRWSPADFAGPRLRQRDVPANVPLDTRVAGEEGVAGSLIGLLRVALPSSDDDPRRRLHDASRRLGRGRVRRNRLGLRAVADDLPTRYAAFALRRVGNRRTVALTVSTFRPLGPLSILGRPVNGAVAIPWLPPRANCFSILLTYGDRATLSVLTDGTVDRTRDLASCWADEVHQMRAVCVPGAGRSQEPQ